MTTSAEDLLAHAVRTNVTAALDEDVGSGDISALLIDDGVRARARVMTRSAGIFCGAPWIVETCTRLSTSIAIEFSVRDGDVMIPGEILFTLAGPARAILTAERTILNFAQLLSATSTRTRQHADLIGHTRAKLLDTRKTLPGLRVAQKYAVRVGGGHNHRMGLYDQYLIKENHIAAAGSIRGAVHKANRSDPDKLVEVEVENLAELNEAIAADADIALIDNFSLEMTRQAVAAAAGRIELEASGGITVETITDIAETGVDYISCGDLTKRVTPIDLSMRITG